MLQSKYLWIWMLLVVAIFVDVCNMYSSVPCNRPMWWLPILTWGFSLKPRFSSKYRSLIHLTLVRNVCGCFFTRHKESLPQVHELILNVAWRYQRNGICWYLISLAHSWEPLGLKPIFNNNRTVFNNISQLICLR